MDRTVRTIVLDQSLQHLRATMQRLWLQLGRKGWRSTDGQRIVFGEYPYMSGGYRVNTSPDPLWGTFSAFDWAPNVDAIADEASVKMGEKRATWHVLWWTKSSMRPAYDPKKGIYSAGIEAFEESKDRTRVVFLDGYNPEQPLLARPCIGPAFQEFSDWVISEITGGQRNHKDQNSEEPSPDDEDLAEIREWFAERTASVRGNRGNEEDYSRNAQASLQSTEWDLFISHASEDKEEIARPLAERLRAEGLRVWFDEFELRVGDSLRRSIDRGLSECRHGVVILSHSFFAKDWPQRELDGLVARATGGGGERVILPVWHGIGVEEVRSYSITLADIVAVRSDDGLDHVVSELLRAIRVERQP
jgi:hypothetical protein